MARCHTYVAGAYNLSATQLDFADRSCCWNYQLGNCFYNGCQTLTTNLNPCESFFSEFQGALLRQCVWSLQDFSSRCPPFNGSNNLWTTTSASTTGSSNTGLIVAGVVLVVCIVAILGCAAWFKMHKKKKKNLALNSSVDSDYGSSENSQNRRRKGDYRPRMEGVFYPGPVGQQPLMLQLPPPPALLEGTSFNSRMMNTQIGVDQPAAAPVPDAVDYDALRKLVT